MENEREPDVGRVKSVYTAFRIVELLKESNGCRLIDVANELDLAKSTAHRHLDTLMALRYVVKEGEQYYPGFRFLALGEYCKTRKQGFSLAEAKVKELARETDERAQFMVEEYGEVMYIFRETGERAVLTDPGIGKSSEIHASSAGKAILSCYSDEEVKDIVGDGPLKTLTEHTIESVPKLIEELQTIRDRGYAINDEESIEGLRAVGVPIRGEKQEVIGALSVSGPTHRLKGDWFENEIPDLLLGVANELELNIRHA